MWACCPFACSAATFSFLRQIFQGFANLVCFTRNVDSLFVTPLCGLVIFELYHILHFLNEIWEYWSFWCNEIIIGERWNYFAVQTYFAKITQRDKNRSQLNIESSPLVLCVHFVIHIPPSSNRFQKNVFVFLINLSWCPFCQICNFPDRSTPPSTSASWLRDLPDEDDPFLRRSP